MKWRSLFFLFTCLMMQKLGFGQDRTKVKISVAKKAGLLEFQCIGGLWDIDQDGSTSEKFSLSYNDEAFVSRTCLDKTDSPKDPSAITVKIRTCDNCIELDAPALSAIIMGNLLATFLIACAVYSITSQPKGKNFSGNKASDKVNLITNGDGDTYQRLTGPSSEYSRLERKK